MNKLKMPLELFPTVSTMNPRMESSHNVTNNLGKMRIKRTNGWSYAKFIGDNQDIPWDTDQMLGAYVEIITEMYLKEFPNTKVDDHEFQKSLSKNERSDMEFHILRLSRRLFRSGLPRATCRIFSENYSYILDIHGSSNDEVFAFISITFDNKQLTCKCSSETALQSLFGDKHFVRITNTPYYMGNGDKELDAVIRSEKNINLVDDTTINLMYIGIKHLIEINKQQGSDNEKLTIYHSNTEIYFIKKCITLIGRGYLWPTDIKNWVVSDKDNEKSQTFDRKTIDFCRYFIDTSEEYVPLIDLNDKEMNFIFKYVEKNHLISSDENKTFNLIPYLENTLYGDTLRYPIERTIDGKMYTIITSFILEENSNDLRMFLCINVTENILLVGSIDYTDISNFHIIDSIIRMNVSAIFLNTDVLPNDITELNNMVPFNLLDPKELRSIIEEILAIHIIIHDRPVRTRMIKCSTRVKKEVSDDKRKEVIKEDNFVITRILKTATDAKEYVARMSSKGYIDREYSLETWNRRGHYRRIKGGYSVWVPPTTCHRHLPLTEKELHIKL